MGRAAVAGECSGLHPNAPSSRCLAAFGPRNSDAPIGSPVPTFSSVLAVADGGAVEHYLCFRDCTSRPNFATAAAISGVNTRPQLSRRQ